MTDPTPALWPTAHQAILAGQSPAIPGPAPTDETDDLRSRLACVMEATYWDRPYDTRIAAIRGMCDLDTNGMTPAGLTAAPLSPAERRRISRANQLGFPAMFSAIEDIITERMGGIPVIPTPSGGTTGGDPS